MNVNPLWALIGLYPRLKLIFLQLLSVLAATIGLVFRQFQNNAHLGARAKSSGEDDPFPRDEGRVSRRAERFAIETTIRYRNVGQNKWYQGKTENISGSGVLFWAHKRVALKTRVEMIFPLLIKGPGGESGAKVRCFGQVVRKVSPAGPKREMGLAATIEEYLLMRAEEVPHF